MILVWHRNTINKTVLLRERKRHTDRRLSSTPCAVLYGGYPGRVPPWLGYPPVLTWLGGNPGRHPLAGIPPVLSWLRGVPWAGAPWPGYSLARSDGGYPRWGTPSRGTPQLDLAGVLSHGWTWPGYPPRCGQTDGWMDGWMDRHVSKHNLPSYYVGGR